MKTNLSTRQTSRMQIWWIVFGASFGALFVHPTIMILDHFMHETREPGHGYFTDVGTELVMALSPVMLPWILIFAITGGILGFFIVRNKEYTAEISERERRFRETLEGANLIAVQLDNKGTITFANSHLQELTGWKSDEIVGKNLMDIFIPEEIRKETKELFQSIVQGGTITKQYENEIVTKDGKRITVLWTNSHLFDSDRKIIGVTSLGTNITERKEAEEERRLVSEIMSNMTEGVYLITMKDIEIVWVNPKFEEMFGYEPGEMIGKHASIVNAPTDKDPMKTAGEITKVLEETGEWQGEVNNIKKDGTHFWCYANVSVFDHPEYGDVMVAIHSDITERKEADNVIKASLEEKEVFLREIHHRVKNNMNTISALLLIQSTHVKDKADAELFEKSIRRIKAMSLIHERLYQSETLAEVNFGEYVKLVANDIIKSHGAGDVVLKTDVNDVKFDIDTSIPLGLITSELITNSLKYAFPKNKKGCRIEIGLKEAKGGYKLTISDNGKGFPKKVDFKNTKSFGLQIVNMLVGQIKGEIELDTKKGTKFIINFSPDEN